MDDDGMIELQTHRAMVELPENAVEVELTVTVYSEGELLDVRQVLSLADIREAFRKADEGYFDEDDTFVLTDKGRAFLDSLGEE